MEYQQYLDSHTDDVKDVRDYGYSTPANHNPENWGHLLCKPRWCYQCNGINVEPECRLLHPYSLTLEESPQPVGANLANVTTISGETVKSTYTDEDTWSILSEIESIDSADPTQIVKCPECKGRVQYADMIREL